MRELINLIDNLAESWTPEPWTPNWDPIKVYSTPKSITLYHATNSDKPVISTKSDRLIPKSLSTKKNPDRIWGNKVYKFKIPQGTVVADVPGIFSILPDDASDTPLNIGKVLRLWAQENGIQILKIGKVGGVGTEWAILDPSLIKNYVTD